MTQLQALKIVYDLASENALDERTVRGDDALEEEKENQEQALEIVSKMIWPGVGSQGSEKKKVK